MIYPSRIAVVGAWLALIVFLVWALSACDGMEPKGNDPNWIMAHDLSGNVVICRMNLDYADCRYEGEW